MRLECAQTIAQLRQKYDPANINYDELNCWVFKSISYSLNSKQPSFTLETLYLDCSITYHPQLLLFNIYKNPSVHLITHDNCSYDVSIFAGIHFEQLFGEANITKLRQTVWLSDADIMDVANSIAEEIHDWCNNIEEIFDALKVPY